MREPLAVSVATGPLALVLRSLPIERGRPEYETRGTERIPLTRDEALWLARQLVEAAKSC